MGSASPIVSDVNAKQRYPWNGLVDITCKVTGIVGTASGCNFNLAAVIPDSDEVRNVSEIWVMRDGMRSTDLTVCTNGNYHLIWDARADLGEVRYSNMVVRLTITPTVYTVTYKPGAKGSGVQQTATKTHDIGLTLNDAIFNRSGYTQTGWSTRDDGAKAYDLGDPYAANAPIVLYPYWSPNAYAVTYKPGAKGSGLDQAESKWHDIDLPLKGAVFTCDGYTQTGWATSDGGAKAYDLGGYYAANAPIALYPYWSPDAYTVTYKPGAKGSGLDEAESKWHDIDLPLKDALFTRTGYTQTGWATSDGGAKVYDLGSSYTANAAVTLYPYWERQMVQLWENGPYWATTNIGAEKPEDYGYYFWWGDTVGYKRVGNVWVATDGSSSNFSFGSGNTPTYGKSIDQLKSEGWITSEGALAPAHDAAHVHWGGDWRMPTKDEFVAVSKNCDWTWTTQNGVNGYIVRGRGDYAVNSIFLPCAGLGLGTSLFDTGSDGRFWSSVPNSGSNYAWYLRFYSGYHGTHFSSRGGGQSVRPVQGFIK